MRVYEVVITVDRRLPNGPPHFILSTWRESRPNYELQIQFVGSILLPLEPPTK